MSTLLIEIGCEELPYKVCESVLRQLCLLYTSDAADE